MSHNSSPQPSMDKGNLPTTGTNLDFDMIFDVLSHPHRRQGLSYLLHNGDSASVDELYDHIAKTVEPSENGEDLRMRVKAAFRHCHRPKLEEAELIEYDEKTEVVRATKNAANLKPHLELTA